MQTNSEETSGVWERYERVGAVCNTKNKGRNDSRLAESLSLKIDRGRTKLLSDESQYE